MLCFKWCLRIYIAITCLYSLKIELISLYFMIPQLVRKIEISSLLYNLCVSVCVCMFAWGRERESPWTCLLPSTLSVVWFHGSAPHCLKTTSAQPVSLWELFSYWWPTSKPRPLRRKALYYKCVPVFSSDSVWTLVSQTVCYMLKVWIRAWWGWTFTEFLFDRFVCCFLCRQARGKKMPALTPTLVGFNR